MINSKEEKNISQNKKNLNYNNHSQDELVSILNNLINKKDLHNYFKEIEIIKSTFYKNINETNLDLENNFKKIYQSFKSKKKLYRIELQKTLNTLLEENKELRKLITKQQEQIGDIIPRIGNTTTNLNVQMFLQESCKDALNISEFI